jgi:perosamine synthetase
VSAVDAVQPTLPITRPFFGEDEERILIETLRSGWVVQGPRVAEFERAVADHTGAQHAIATTSCTTALHLALIAAGIGPGDEVIVPAFTWIATANVVEYVGARPVFCDIDPITYNIDPAQVEAAITPETKAILPVHLFGLCADMEELRAISDAHGVTIIEDAACALDAWQDARHAGMFGQSGCFSFHPRKIITTGEGGMVITNDDDVALKCRILRDHGAAASDLVRHESTTGHLLGAFEQLGFNYRMTDLQAAVGVCQMGKLDAIQDSRRRLAARYDDLLEDIPWLDTPAVPDGNRHAYQAYVCQIASEPNDDLDTRHAFRNRVMQILQAGGISTRQGTHAVHNLGFYAKKYGLSQDDFPASLAADRLTIALPLYHDLTEQDQDHVVASLAAAGAH